MKRTLVILPTYNEVENIPSLVDKIMKYPDALHILVVDDSSQDGTAAAVRALQTTYGERLHLLVRKGKLGLGTAYIAGYKYAIEHDYELAVTMDADHSHNPVHLKEILHMAKIADLVIGSRYIAGGGTLNWGPHRKFLSWGANLLARSLLGLQARDCTSGYRCYRVNLLRRINFQRIHSNGYSFLMELLHYCQTNKARIREIPIVFADREFGKSKISQAEIFKAFLTLWRLRKT
ncbi:MAG: polyprenol monophosphomannose synthase [Sumerlaeia bacterium]